MNKIKSIILLGSIILQFRYSPGCSLLVFALLLTGCTSYGSITNKPVKQFKIDSAYSLTQFGSTISNVESGQSLLLTFSGGGTRAAALSYGILEELRDTQTRSGGKVHSLLDDVGVISSVSGGSFTAAYYGLYGDRIFDDYKERFLTKNIQGMITRSFLNPLHLFSSESRTENVIGIYDREIFDGATFNDMLRPNLPMILINATDLSTKARFSFMQEYFNLLCSDLSSFSVSRAVTASSAVPLLFPPVVVKNHSGCVSEIPEWLVSAKLRSKKDSELALIVKGMEGYFEKEKYPYLHFVDGGITDNLGLRSIFDIARVAGGTQKFFDYLKIKPASRLVIISIDASTDSDSPISKEKKVPGIGDLVDVLSSIQLNRYSSATIEATRTEIDAWLAEASNIDDPVEVYFIMLSFDDIKNPELRNYLDKIPTSLALSNKQVKKLIQAGRNLLRNNSEFQRLLQRN